MVPSFQQPNCFLGRKRSSSGSPRISSWMKTTLSSLRGKKLLSPSLNRDYRCLSATLTHKQGGGSRPGTGRPVGLPGGLGSSWGRARGRGCRGVGEGTLRDLLGSPGSAGCFGSAATHHAREPRLGLEPRTLYPAAREVGDLRTQQTQPTLLT